MKIRFSIIIISLIIIALSLNSCKEKNAINISGKISDTTAKNIVLERLSPIKVDSIAATSIDLNGNFEISFCDSIKRLYRLRVGNLQPIYLCLQNGDRISIAATCNDITSYQVDGSPDCTELKRLNEHLAESSRTVEELRSKVGQEYNLSREQLEECNRNAEDLYKSDKQFIKEFINKNHTSPIAYFAMCQYVSTTPLMQLSSDYETYKYVLAEMKTHNPQLDETRYLESTIKKYDLQQEQINRNYIKLEEGATAPDFSLCDSNGEKHTLSEFSGHETTICFWATWDSKSVTEAQNCIAGNNGKQIILISLDNNREIWMQAIKLHKLENATNLCDFKSWEGIVTKTYGIKKLPSTIEISSEGKIESIH